ncbi:MAG: hypothetical protein EAZ61_09810 [Oscillatoriales cyanobacterium]|nr:MAG: hypothetical protein EAZ61_09810 [Oscillatoriales cyanobacterium]
MPPSSPHPSAPSTVEPIGDRLLNAIGNLNPQFLRELKGQLKPRNLSLALGLSLLAQGLLYFMFQAGLPPTDQPFQPTHHTYCLTDGHYNCLFDADGVVKVDWNYWGTNFSHTLGAGLITILVLGGVYQLIANYAKERQTGTLDFLRLTPQSGDRIFLGKILGVPAMVYLAVFAALPLHAYMTLMGGSSLLNLGLFYVSAIEIAVLFFCAAMLIACLGTNQAWLGVLVSSAMLYPAVAVLYVLFAIPEEFFGDLANRSTIFLWWIVPLSQSRLALMSFCWVWTGIGIYWIWQALGRLFRNSKATLLSKTQTYWLTAELTVFWLGFAMQPFSVGWSDWEPMLYFMSVFYLTITIALNLILMPPRQSVQDWARYHHVNAAEGLSESETRRSIWLDLLIGEKSPPTLAIAVQLLATCLVCIAWVIAMHGYWAGNLGWTAIGILLVSFASMLMLSGLLQHILHWKLKQRHALILACFFALLVIPPILLGVADLSVKAATDLWTLFVFAGSTFAIEQVTLTALLGAFTWQLATAGLLTYRFKRSIEVLGRSEVRRLIER